MSEENGTFYASFQPEEAGEWKIHVTYDGQDIEHSPFKCMVFNPRAIVVSISYFPFQTFIYIIEEVGLNSNTNQIWIPYTPKSDFQLSM